MQQALIMFGSMVLMIVMAMAHPHCCRNRHRYWLLHDGPKSGSVALSMYTGVEPFLRNCSIVCLCRLADGTRWNGSTDCQYGSIHDW